MIKKHDVTFNSTFIRHFDLRFKRVLYTRYGFKVYSQSVFINLKLFTLSFFENYRVLCSRRNVYVLCINNNDDDDDDTL